MTAKKKPADKKPQGRPTRYKPEYDELAYNFCLLGATDAQMGEFFGVSEQTVNSWKKNHPTFLESIKSGKLQADALAAQSLFKRATGYVGKKTVTATHEGVVTDTRVVDDYVGPDTGAAIFWLKNRQPSLWRDKKEIEMLGDETEAELDWSIGSADDDAQG